MSNPFPLHTIDSAPETVRGAMKAMQKRMGFVSTMLGKFAEAPALLMVYQAAASFFEQTFLTPGRADCRPHGRQPPPELRLLYDRTQLGRAQSGPGRSRPHSTAARRGAPRQQA